MNRFSDSEDERDEYANGCFCRCGISTTLPSDGKKEPPAVDAADG